MGNTSRKLTTVFSADVQGYSRLMGSDEEGTLATLKSYREAMARLIAAHGGRVVNTWGDGLIAEFPSVVEAVRTAVDVQNELGARNASRPSETRMDFRIGINLGDVIADGDDIYGDGVNVAARLQASAEPGGIIISRTVHDQVRNKLSVGFDFLGDLAVKNIDEAVPSYAVRVGDSGVAPRTRAGRAERSAAIDGVPTPPGSAFPLGRRTAMLGIVAAGLVAINLVASPHEFWSRWPLLVIAVVLALRWAVSTTVASRKFTFLGVIACALVVVNLMSWQGNFWAIWPLLVLAFAAAARWVRDRTR